jgi:hypothetical protein
LGCAISTGQYGKSSCCGGGLLLAASDCGRLVCFSSQRFRAKFLAYANSDSFPNTGLCANSEPDSCCDSEGADAHQSESYAYSNCNPESDAIGFSRSECHPNSHANTSAFGFSSNSRSYASAMISLIFSDFRNYSLFNVRYQTIFVKSSAIQRIVVSTR